MACGEPRTERLKRLDPAGGLTAKKGKKPTKGDQRTCTSKRYIGIPFYKKRDFLSEGSIEGRSVARIRPRPGGL